MLAAGRATSADGVAIGPVHHTSVPWQPVDQTGRAAAQMPAVAAARTSSSDGNAAQRVPLDLLLLVSLCIWLARMPPLARILGSVGSRCLLGIVAAVSIRPKCLRRTRADS